MAHPPNCRRKTELSARQAPETILEKVMTLPPIETRDGRCDPVIQGNPYPEHADNGFIADIDLEGY
jgi:hypothetical protein